MHTCLSCNHKPWWYQGFSHLEEVQLLQRRRYLWNLVLNCMLWSIPSDPVLTLHLKAAGWSIIINCQTCNQSVHISLRDLSHHHVLLGWNAFQIFWLSGTMEGIVHVGAPENNSLVSRSFLTKLYMLEGAFLPYGSQFPRVWYTRMSARLLSACFAIASSDSTAPSHWI